MKTVHLTGLVKPASASPAAPPAVTGGTLRSLTVRKSSPQAINVSCDANSLKPSQQTRPRVCKTAAGTHSTAKLEKATSSRGGSRQLQREKRSGNRPCVSVSEAWAHGLQLRGLLHALLDGVNSNKKPCKSHIMERVFSLMNNVLDPQQTTILNDLFELTVTLRHNREFQRRTTQDAPDPIA